MQEQNPITATGKVTQRPLALWSPEEIARLGKFASHKACQKALIEAFPGRTLKAIKVKLSQVRKAKGIKPMSVGREQVRIIAPTILHPKDPGAPDFWTPEWRARCEAASLAYTAALMQIAA